MKRTGIVLLALVLAFSLCACSSRKEIEAEKHSWDFSIVQISDGGKVIYCARDKKNLYENAEVLDLSCTFENKVMTITENNSSESWQFRYKFNSESQQTQIYNLKPLFDEDIEGFASVGLTQYHDGISEYTLVIYYGDYALYFYEK